MKYVLVGYTEMQGDVFYVSKDCYTIDEDLAKKFFFRRSAVSKRKKLVLNDIDIIFCVQKYLFHKKHN